jgi:hypothetical protein
MFLTFSCTIILCCGVRVCCVVTISSVLIPWCWNRVKQSEISTATCFCSWFDSDQKSCISYHSVWERIFVFKSSRDQAPVPTCIAKDLENTGSTFTNRHTRLISATITRSYPQNTILSLLHSRRIKLQHTGV